MIKSLLELDWVIMATDIVGLSYCGRPWPAAYININQNTHQIQVLTEALCRVQAIFYSLPKTSGVPNIVG